MKVKYIYTEFVKSVNNLFPTISWEVISAQAGKRHGMIKRTNSQIRKLRGTTTLSKQDGKIVKSYMPYSLRG
jgi:large subunit ribosomal protein L35